MWRIIIIYCCIIFFIGHLYAQQDCEQENMKMVKDCLIETLGINWFKVFDINPANRMCVEIITDTSGTIREINKLRILGMKISEFRLFKKNLISKYKVCIYNPEVEYNFNHYIKITKGKFSYKYCIVSAAFKTINK